MASDTEQGWDEQDQAEVYDEDNMSLDGAGDIDAEMRTFEELPEVFDSTRAVGDDDDDEALIGEELDDDDIIELEADSELADLEDDDLAPRMDDWLAGEAAEEGDVLELDAASQPDLLDGTDGGIEAVEARIDAARSPEDAELEFTDDLDDVPDATGRTAARMESRGELSDEDLEDLGYRDEKGPR